MQDPKSAYFKERETMQRKVLLLIICLLTINAALGIRSFVFDSLPAKASEAQQETQRRPEIGEYVLLNQAGPLWLASINLSHVNLNGARLVRANLRWANLSGADLRSADLHGADLRRADLSGANLGGANLRSANLRGANLGGANLNAAVLSEAVYDGSTVLPEGLDVAKMGMIARE
jgi:hypothetical protein